VQIERYSSVVAPEATLYGIMAGKGLEGQTGSWTRGWIAVAVLATPSGIANGRTTMQVMLVEVAANKTGVPR
jgi:hypothetical protein